jgi:hypothetical protein
MRIKMLNSVTGRRGPYARGQVVDAPEAEALQLIRRGAAVRAGRPAESEVSADTPELESAALAEPEEAAVTPKPQRKRKGKPPE